jgi:hypothetical protein
MEGKGLQISQPQGHLRQSNINRLGFILDNDDEVKKDNAKSQSITNM